VSAHFQSKNDKSTFNFCKADHFKEKNKIIKSCYNWQYNTAASKFSPNYSCWLL